MKKLEIIAKDKDGNVLGREMVDKPETWEEFLDTFDQEQIMKYTWADFVIDKQRELRSGNVNPLLKAFKALTKEQQEALLANAKK